MDISTDARSQLQGTQTSSHNSYLATRKDESSLKRKQTCLIHLMFTSKKDLDMNKQCPGGLRPVFAKKHCGLGEQEERRRLGPLY